MESTISYGYPYASVRIQTGTNCSENKSTPMKAARFPIYRDLAGSDFSVSKVDESLIRQLAKQEFTDTSQNAVLFGVPRTGKIPPCYCAWRCK